MKIIKRETITPTDLPGRRIWKAVGRDSFSDSEKITFGFAYFSTKIGSTEPHHHAEEICYVLAARNAWVHFGAQQDQLGALLELEKGMTLHIPNLEWHQFVCKDDGYLDIVFIYGQVDNIRPEEMIVK